MGFAHYPQGTAMANITSMTGLIMRLVCIATALVISALSTAEAREIRVISPGVIVIGGLQEVADAFTKETGVSVTIVPDGMGKIVDDIKTATPAADVVMLPQNLMSSLALDGGLKSGSFLPLGRVYIGVFAKPNAPHPDISTVGKLVAVLKTASVVLYSDPASGSMQAAFIDKLLQGPEFAGVHGQKIKGDSEPALRRGDGDNSAMGIGLIHVADPNDRTEDPYVVGLLPIELNAYLDMATAVSARAPNVADAVAFVQFATEQKMRPVWKAKGTNRY